MAQASEDAGRAPCAAWQIADFTFSPELNQLDGPQGAVHLEPRTTAVLRDLVEHAGAVRTREALLAAVWDDAFVGEAALTHCVWELRKAFGDDARKPRFIQTIPRRGYRLIAPARRPAARQLAALLAVAADRLAPPDDADIEVGQRLAATAGARRRFERPLEAVRYAVALRAAA
ncbi:MAG: winged helix-turn-helix domain-containing protein, partial [Acidobacteriota bacterium]